MSPLDHKLFRDLWRIKLQAGAIALVVAVGVMLQVMMSGMVISLQETLDTYYERYRMAQVFAPATRAPNDLLEQIADIPGVVAVEGRVRGGALIDIDGQDLPVRALAMSLPELRAPRLNDIYLANGRRLTPGRTEEIVLLQGFAEAHGFGPGDTLTATINGARRTFRIVGLAQAPEFLFTPAPGEMIPDDSRFAVMWMNRRALEAVFDMGGAFNEALVGLDRGAALEAVLDQIDSILDPVGGQGAFGRADLVSDIFISEEISGLRASTAAVPPIFMGVAAFLLYIVIARLVQSEREQIGLVKAFGYTDFEVSWHYFKMVLVVAILGALAGVALGIWAGRSMAGMYQPYYKFPFLVYQIEPSSIVTGLAVSIAAALGGSFFVLRRVFALSPAVAMRPPAPADFSRSGALNDRLRRFLDQPSRMVLRRILRNPGRIAGAVIGISVGMGLSSAQLGLMSGFDTTIYNSFTLIDRSDVTVSFIKPMPLGTVHALQQVDGVIEVEPARGVGVTFHHGRESYRGSINGFVASPKLNRAITDDLQGLDMPAEGIVLGRSLAGILDVDIGQTVRADVQDGRRPTIDLRVAEIADTLMGAPAYMHLPALNAALFQPGQITTAFLRIDGAKSGEVYRALKGMPMVAGVSVKEDARRSFQNLMDQGAGSMRFVMAAVAAIITFGIVYNTARIAFGEQARDLASLRVIGFTEAETAFILLGELAVVVLLALPIGIGLGFYLTQLVAAGFSTDIYQIPAYFEPDAYGTAAVAVILATLVSGWLVRRDIRKIDLVETLKTRE